MGPGSCIDSEQGLIKHEQVIQFHILIPVFKQFLSSSPVSGSPPPRWYESEERAAPPLPCPG